MSSWVSFTVYPVRRRCHSVTISKINDIKKPSYENANDQQVQCIKRRHLLVVVIELANFRRNFTNLPPLQTILGIKHLPVHAQHIITRLHRYGIVGFNVPIDTL